MDIIKLRIAHLEKNERSQKKVLALSSGTSTFNTLAPLTAAAFTTAAIMYPVDVMRALAMSGSSIGEFYKIHGLKGFASQGVLPELAKSSSMRVSKFFFFPIVCEGFWGVSPKEATPVQKGIAGAFATIPEILLVSPMEVAKLGLQLDKKNEFKNNSTQFTKHIWQTRGINGLYSGWLGMQWRQSAWTGTYFATLNLWKEAIEPKVIAAGGPQLLAQLLAGFLAGMFATIPNAPGDVVRSVVQKKVFNDPKRPVYGLHPGAIAEHLSVASELIAQKGILGLYQGLPFKAAHLGGSGALMAVLIPQFSKLMGIDYGGV